MTHEIVKENSLLDNIYRAFQEQNLDLNNTFNKLLIGLYEIRQNLAEKDWNIYIEKARKHPIHEELLKDPHTKRSYEKPRGYAGDAVLIDYFFYGNSYEKDINGIGLKIFRVVNMTQASLSLCERPKIIGNAIDTFVTTENKDDIRVLSIACGHLREASNSSAIRDKKISELIAIDLDKESLEVIKKDYTHLNVHTINCDYKDIILKKAFFQSLGKFDFIYSAGFFDYLSDSAAKKLLKSMYTLLKPGGKMIIPNFVPMIESGYMEAFMDWYMIYRDTNDMEKLSHCIPTDKIEHKKIFYDKFMRMVFLEIDKKR
ncbi:MAG: class I SAM-dependent methyltransferase [Candidatus Brocadiaceae bacterium]